MRFRQKYNLLERLSYGIPIAAFLILSFYEYLHGALTTSRVLWIVWLFFILGLHYRRSSRADLEFTLKGIRFIEAWDSTLIPWENVEGISFIEKTWFKSAQFVIRYIDRGPVVIKELKYSPADQQLFIWMLKRFAPQLAWGQELQANDVFLKPYAGKIMN